MDYRFSALEADVKKLRQDYAELSKDFVSVLAECRDMAAQTVKLCEEINRIESEHIKERAEFSTRYLDTQDTWRRELLELEARARAAIDPEQKLREMSDSQRERRRLVLEITKSRELARKQAASGERGIAFIDPK